MVLNRDSDSMDMGCTSESVEIHQCLLKVVCIYVQNVHMLIIAIILINYISLKGNKCCFQYPVWVFSNKSALRITLEDSNNHEISPESARQLCASVLCRPLDHPPSLTPVGPPGLSLGQAL